MRAALPMLAKRFVLKHDELAYKERKSANDRDRYEGYNYMLGIATEAWLPTRGSDACYPPLAASSAGCAVLGRKHALFAANRLRPDEAAMHESFLSEDRDCLALSLADEYRRFDVQDHEAPAVPGSLARAPAASSRKGCASRASSPTANGGRNEGRSAV